MKYHRIPTGMMNAIDVLCDVECDAYDIRAMTCVTYNGAPCVHPKILHMKIKIKKDIKRIFHSIFCNPHHTM